MRNFLLLSYFLSDKLVLASSGEEVLFTDSDIEPELDIKVLLHSKIEQDLRKLQDFHIQKLIDKI